MTFLIALDGLASKMCKHFNDDDECLCEVLPLLNDVFEWYEQP